MPCFNILNLTARNSAEIFPTHIRSQGMAVSMVGLYLADIILLVAGPIALNNIGWKFFLVLIIPTALHIVFVYFMCPETKGRSLVSLHVCHTALHVKSAY